MISKTKFQLSLLNKFEEKRYSEKTKHNYIRNLELLNDKKPFRNLAFLDDFEKIIGKLKHLKSTTIRNYYASIVAVLSLYKTKFQLLKKYESLLNNEQIKIDKSNSNITESQEKNWITPDDITQKLDELSKKDLTNYDNILYYLILSLYTKIPPRRNKDYLNMYIVSNLENISNDYNYFSITDKLFVFNDYKTKHKYGCQKIDVPIELYDIIMKYLNVYSPMTKYFKNGLIDTNMKIYEPLLGGRSENYITRILNKIFQKNVSSTILRHIYLSYKYPNGIDSLNKLNEAENDALKMGHSLRTAQLVYIKEV